MGAFFVYILKASVCLGVFYLFYRLLLSRETFHRFNRLAILGILALSLVIPLCEITIQQETEVHQTVLTLEQLLLMADMQPEAVAEKQVVTVTYVQVVLFIYFIGILFFLCRNIYSLIRLFKLLRTSRKERMENGINLIIHDNPQLSPFSWMRYIVISQKDLDENGREILIHEMAHISHRHSIDLLIAEICIFFQWFNPAAWLLKQELQNIHEFQADETVIREGVNAKEYQLLLIKKAVGTRLYSMANSFNHSKLKKRITMMLKEKSSPWARLKYLYILPLAAIAVTAFARPEISNELKEFSAVKVNDLTAIVETNEVQNEKEATPDIPPQAISNDKEEPSGDYMMIQNATIISPENPDVILTVEKGYFNLKPTTEEVSALLGKIPEKNQDKKEEFYIAIPENRNSGYLNKFESNGEEPLILIDGEEVTNNILRAIDSNKIESISVLKDKTSAKLYGRKAKNGVILVTTKKPQSRWNIESKAAIESIIYTDISEKIKVTGTVKDTDGEPIAGAIVMVSGTIQGTVTDMDGNFVLVAPSNAQIQVSYIDMDTKMVKVEPVVNVVMGYTKK